MYDAHCPDKEMFFPSAPVTTISTSLHANDTTASSTSVRVLLPETTRDVPVVEQVEFLAWCSDGHLTRGGPWGRRV